MGVMSCSRKWCDNIMCDTYVPCIGYVCRECQEEFKNYLNQQGDLLGDSESEIERELEKFINTEKGEYNKRDRISIDEFFSRHTS